MQALSAIWETGTVWKGGPCSSTPHSVSACAISKNERGSSLSGRAAWSRTHRLISHASAARAGQEHAVQAEMHSPLEQATPHDSVCAPSPSRSTGCRIQSTASRSKKAEKAHGGNAADGPAYITARIKGTSNWRELLDTLHAFRPHLNGLHASAATTHAAQLLQGVEQQQQHPSPLPQQQQQQQGAVHTAINGQLMSLLLELQWQHAGSFAARQAANSFWALAKLQQVQSEGVAAVPFPLLHRLMARLEACMTSAKPQELANVMWALASLRLRPSPSWLHAWCTACDACWHLFKFQELSTLLWGCGSLGWQGVSPAWLQRALCAHELLLTRCRPQELVMGLWGLAQALQHQQQLCTTKASTDTGPSSSSSSRSRNDDVSQTMSQVGSSNSAFAATFATPSPSHPHPTTAASPLSLQQVVLGACNGGWGAAFAASARAQLQRFSGSELAMLLSSLAALRSPPAAALHAPAKGPPTEPLHGDLQGAPSTSPFTTHATLYPPSMCTSETGTKETTPARVKPTQADSEENSGSPSTDVHDSVAHFHDSRTCFLPSSDTGLEGQPPSSHTSQVRMLPEGHARQDHTLLEDTLPRRLLKGSPLLSLALPALHATAQAACFPSASSSSSSAGAPPGQESLEASPRGAQRSSGQPLPTKGPLLQQEQQQQQQQQQLFSHSMHAQPPAAVCGAELHALRSYLQAPARGPAKGDSHWYASHQHAPAAQQHPQQQEHCGGTSHLGPREACSLLRSAAGLQLRPGKAACAWVAAMVERAVGGRDCSAHDLVDTLVGAARLAPGLLSPPTLTRLWHAAEAHHPKLDAHGLLLCVWALARLRVMPSGKLLAALQRETDGLLQQQQQQQQQQHPQGADQQQQQQQQQQLQQQVRAQMPGRGPSFPPQPSAPSPPSSPTPRLDWSTELPQRPAAAAAAGAASASTSTGSTASFSEAGPSSPCPPHPNILTPSEVAAVCWAFGALRVRPDKLWLMHVLGSVWRNVHSYRNDELAQVVLALGRMRCRPSEEWAEWLATELQGRVSVATPPLQVVQMVHAVAACMPDSGPMEDWVLTAAGEVLLHHIQELGPTELVSLVWACARMGRNVDEDYAFSSVHAPGTVLPIKHGSNDANGAGSEQDDGEGALALKLGALEDADEGAAGVGAGEGTKGAGEDKEGVGAGAAATDEGMKCSQGQAHKKEDVVAGGGDDGSSSSSSSYGGHGSSSDRSVDAGVHTQEGVMLWHSGHRLRLSKPAAATLTRACGACLDDLDAQQFSMLLISLPRLGMWLPEEWLERRTFSRPHDLRTLSNQDLCTQLYVCGKLHVMPPAPWLKQALHEVRQRAGNLNGHMVSGILQGLSSLGYSPGEEWLNAVVLTSGPALARMQAKKLTKAYAAAVDLEPALALLWGHNFDSLFSVQQRQWRQAQRVP